MSIATSFDLLKKLAFEKFKQHFPVMAGWFSPEALEPGGELYNLLQTLSGESATFRESAKDRKNGTFLLDAIGDDATAWGDDTEMPALPGEDDATHMLRIQTEILRPRLTRSAIVQAVEDATGLTTTILLPWQQMDYRSSRTPGTTGPDPVYGRSGSRRRTGTYYNGGIIDVVTLGYSQATRAAAQGSAAAGVKLYFTAKRQFAEIPAPDLTQSHIKNRIKVFLTPLCPPRAIRSGLDLRSGGPSSRLLSRTRHREYVTPAWNYLMPDSVLTWEELSGYTWAQALAGPVYAQPRPMVTVGP